MAKVNPKIAAELENIESLLAELPCPSRCGDLSRLELAGVAAILHNFYTGIEKILLLIIRWRGVKSPQGDSWHRDLLEMTLSLHIISAKTAEELKPYLAFRHFFSHAYALDLDPLRMRPLVENVKTVFDLFLADVRKHVP